MILVFTGNKIDFLLTLSHCLHIFLQGDQFALLVAVQHQKILAGILVGTVVGNSPVFQLTAKGGIEFFILLPVVFQHIL